EPKDPLPDGSGGAGAGGLGGMTGSNPDGPGAPSGGSPGTGGAAGPGTGGAGADEVTPTNDAGCACTASSRLRQGNATWAALLTALGLGTWRMRRRRAASSVA